ncbi:MAG: sulfurtransferase TusA family protein [Pseudomonadota bacterium]
MGDESAAGENTTDHEWDLRGLRCPLPVLKARNRMRQLGDGEQVWVVTDDPMAMIDIPNFAREYGQGLIDQTQGPGDEARFLLERRGKL